VDRLLTCAVEVKVAEPSKLHSWHNSGNFVAILKKRADGKWLCSHLI